MRRFSLLLLSSFALLTPLAPGSDPAGAASPHGSDEAIEALDLDALHGKVVVVEIMETWCGACRSAIPTLNRWHERWSERGLYVVVASPEPAEKLRRYRDDNGLSAHAAVDVDGAAARRFEASAYPTYVVLDRDGAPRGRFRGAGQGLQDAEAAFTPLVETPAVPDGVRFD